MTVDVLILVVWVGGEVVALWVLFEWLPFHVRCVWIDARYGRPRDKQAAIKGLFDGGRITLVGYEGCPYYHSEQFEFRIVGPFGEHIRKGTHSALHAVDGCPPLPPEVAGAFEGYLGTSADVIHLLWDRTFLETLPQKKMLYAKDGFSVPWSLTIIAD